jgi:hypothetical protein
MPDETTTTETEIDEQVIVVDADTGAVIADDDHPPPRAGQMGRPPIVINLRKLHAVASTFATYEEMAVIFDCSEQTLRTKYNREIKKGRLMGKMSYRQMMNARAKISDRVLIHMYEKHVEPSNTDKTFILAGDSARPLIIREVDEDSDTRSSQ